MYTNFNQVDKKSTKFQKIISISSKYINLQYFVKFQFFKPKSGASNHFKYLENVIFKLKVNKVS